ncbi:hypothetical protein Tco_0472270 [Tanacetum coccineum]
MPNCSNVEFVLDIVSLFNIPGVSHDAVMLRVFPITLTGASKRWVDRLPPRTINSWDLLKKAFIQMYCPPSRIAKQLEEIRNFKQEGDVTLYQAWEWYNDLLYKCPTHDINNHQKKLARNSRQKLSTGLEMGMPLYTPFYYSLKEIKYFFANSGFYDNEEHETDDSRMAEAVAPLKATLKKKREEPKKIKQNESYEEIVYKITNVENEKYSAPQEKREHWCREILQEKENERQSLGHSCIKSASYVDGGKGILERPEECGEDKANIILGVIHDKLNNDWFNNTSEDEDDLEGILDYLKPRSYDGFIDLDDEAYNKRRLFVSENGIRSRLNSYSCGSKVLSRRETRLFYRHFARSHLLQLSLGEENDTQGSLLL